MTKPRAGQKAFTLVELLVVVALTAIITMVTGTVVIQMLTESQRSSGRLTASQQVQNAGFWFKRDGAMAQTVMLDDLSTGDITEFITLEWTDWDGTSHRSAYTLEDAGSGLNRLMRSYSVGGNTQTMFVADSITSASANWTRPVLSMTITVQVGSQNAARTYQVKPRPIN